MENIAVFGDPAGGVQTLVVPVSERGRALEQLRLMNITRTSLFPGLEGFARSFRQLPVKETQEERVRRAILRGLEGALDKPDAGERPAGGKR
jgi:hypothetical protein